MTQDKRRNLRPVLALLALAVLMFVDVLARGPNAIAARAGYDVWAYFYWMRDWGFTQLAHGNLALWNPQISCGTPFFGGGQIGMLYPPHVLHLLLPTAMAFNWITVFHVFLSGAMMYLWVRGHGVSRAAGVMAGGVYMFCGAYFYKILAGHPTFVGAAAYIPLVLWAVDQIFRTGQLRWALIGGIAVAMQVLAGSPQYAFYTGLTAGGYAILNLIRDRRYWWQVLAGGAIMASVAALLCIGQIMPLLALNRESIRAQGLGFEDAAAGGMDPVAFLTLLCPYLLGGNDWGAVAGGVRNLQMNIGAVGLMLALYGAVCIEWSRRRFAVAMIAILCVLAMGAYTPLFRFLYDHVPPFNSFRMLSRFGLFANIFMLLLAAMAFDRVRRLEARTAWVAAISGVIGIGMIVLGVWMYATWRKPEQGAWGWMLRSLDSTGMLMKHASIVGGGSRMPARAFRTALLLGVCGMGFASVAFLLFQKRSEKLRAWGLVTVAIGEVFISAWFARVTAPIPFNIPDEWLSAMKATTAEQRTYQTRWGFPDQAMAYGTYDANGYEAAILTRFKRLTMLISHDARESDDGVAATLQSMPGLCQALRIRYILSDRPIGVIDMPNPMRRVELVDRYTLCANMNAAADAVSEKGFDPRKTVLLEEKPSVEPEAGGSAGSVKVTKFATDSMEIVADVPKPTLLLVTETYSLDWHAHALPDSSQQTYEILPGDLLLRVIPLKAGRHHIRLAYEPRGYMAGMIVSGLTALVCLGLLGAWVVARRRKQKLGAEA